MAGFDDCLERRPAMGNFYDLVEPMFDFGDVQQRAFQGNVGAEFSSKAFVGVNSRTIFLFGTAYRRGEKHQHHEQPQDRCCHIIPP